MLNLEEDVEAQALRAQGWPASAIARHLRRDRKTLRGPDGTRHGTGLFVITLAGDRICGSIRFENSMFPAFGLPRSRKGAKS